MNTITLPPGKYYIGDPCYVFSDDDWDGMCDVIFANLPINGHPEPKQLEYRGHAFFTNFTAYGDGYYYGTDGFGYGVDAGLIGAVPLELVSNDDGLSLGTIMDAPSGITVTNSCGYFNFHNHADNSSLTIETGDDDDGEERDEGDDY